MKRFNVFSQDGKKPVFSKDYKTIGWAEKHALNLAKKTGFPACVRKYETTQGYSGINRMEYFYKYHVSTAFPDGSIVRQEKLLFSSQSDITW